MPNQAGVAEPGAVPPPGEEVKVITRMLVRAVPGASLATLVAIVGAGVKF